MRIAADGYIDLTDTRRVRTPGQHVQNLQPVPEGEALAFLLSHAFPGHRRVVRPMTIEERKRICLALWADSVSERMAVVDRVWRAITVEVPPPPDPTVPQLIQVIRFGAKAYPIYLDGTRTRMIHGGGLAGTDIAPELVFDFDRLTA